MAYTKKNRRKKRQPVEYEAPLTPEEKSKIQYKDDFQKTYGTRIERIGRKFDGKGKQIMYALAGLGVLVILLGIFYTYQRRQANLAQAALGDAIETSQALVTDIPPTAGDTRKTFKTEKERSEATIKEFEAVVNKYGGEFGDKAKYFIAVSRLKLNNEAGIKELQALTGNSGEIGKMSKFALAQAYTDGGKLDEAAKLYQELAALDNPTIAKNTINLALAKIYESQNKNKEAADIYFNIAKSASEAKDLDNKPLPFSQTANQAKEKLQELDPERAKEIKEPELPKSEFPFG